jgi:signal peptide peptidase SppA
MPANFAVFDEDDRAVTLGGDRHIERRGYELIDNIAVIPVCGTLVHKLGQARPWCGMLGYDSVRLNFLTALQDEEAEGILLDVESPGGEVAGCFDLVDMIASLRGTKPVWASVNEQACSGAYAIASAADHIATAGTGVSGSIGVVWMHVDWSKFNEEHGVEVTYLQYGARKTDAAPDMPLSDEAAMVIQKQIDVVGDRFVDTVARNRKLTFKAVREQEAGVFMGTEAVDLGLADAVMPIDQTFDEFRSKLSS